MCRGHVRITRTRSESPVTAPPILDEEFAAALADGPAPLDLGPLSPAEIDAAFDAALADPSATEVPAVLPPSQSAEPDTAVASALAIPTDVAVTSGQPACVPCDDDVITEVHSAAPRGRGESMKRRKRSRKPGDHRHSSQ